MAKTEQYLFLLNIGPVQSFLAEARKSQDLRAGSLILSDLIREAADLLDGITSNQAEVLFPGNLQFSSLPNRLLALVPADKMEEINKCFEKSLRAHFLSEACGEILAMYQSCKKQLNSFPQIYWVAAPFESNADYPTQYKKLVHCLEGVKRIRPFDQLKEKGRKCTMDGRNNVKFYRLRENETPDQVLNQAGKLFHSDAKVFVHKNEKEEYTGETGVQYQVFYKDLQPGEGLSALSFLKRRYRKSEIESYESTAEIALLNTLNQLKESRELEEPIREIKRINAQFFFEENLEPKVFKEYTPGDIGVSFSQIKEWRKMISNAIKDSDGRLKLSKYYALVAFDGDEMGRFISTYGKCPGVHQDISRSLSSFASFAETLIDGKGEKSRKGRTIYAGGDDFLGFLNLNFLFHTLTQLRAEFDRKISASFDFSLSFSAGVVIAHYKAPLSLVLSQCRQLLKYAKEPRVDTSENTKNTLAIGVMKHSGESHQARWRWAAYEKNKYISETAGQLLQLFQTGLVAHSYAQKLRRIYMPLMDKTGRIDSGLKSLLHKDMMGLLKNRDYMMRGATATIAQQQIDTLFKLYEHSGSSLENLFQFLEVIEFISRHVNSKNPVLEAEPKE